jgi:uncharacterized protein (DUF983 family)
MHQYPTYTSEIKEEEAMSQQSADGHDSTGLAYLKRGLFGRCPACGEGRMFRSFLKVADRCEACGEALFHHRADDFPAYLTIVVVGHVIVPLTMYVEIAYAPSYWVHAAIWLPLVVLSSLATLRLLKGLVVAMQWNLGMHGFAAAKAARDPDWIGAVETAAAAAGRPQGVAAS